MVFVRPITGKKLLGTAGQHTVVTDRKVADGGTDAGCTSGELFLLSIASCATGSIRNFLFDRTLPADDIQIDVELIPAKQKTARDDILITVFLPDEILAEWEGPIVAAARSGSVVSRVALGSDIEVRCKTFETLPNRS